MYFKLFTTFFIGLLVPVFTVSAHATPLSYAPASGAVVGDVPTEIVISFNERIELAASSIRIFDPSGARVDTGALEARAADGRTVGVRTTARVPGSYAVSWQVLSRDDGHVTTGAYTFSVGNTTPLETPVLMLDQRTNPFEALAVFLELLGGALAFAWLVLHVVLWSRKFLASERAELYESYSLLLMLVATLLSVTGAALFVLVKSASLASDTLALPNAISLFIETKAGYGALLRLLLSIVFFGFVALLRPALFRSTRGAWASFVLLVVLFASAYLRVETSHAAATQFYPRLSIWINWFHLLAKDLWTGGAMVVSLLYLRLFADKASELDLVRRTFSRATLYAFLVGGLSGLYVIWLHLKNFENIFTTPWGHAFVILSSVAGLLVLFRTRSLFAPERFAYFARREALAAVLVLFVTGWIIVTTPPVSTTGQYDRRVRDQGVTLRLRQDAAQPTVLLLSSSGAGEVVAEAYLRTEQVGPLPVALSKSERGYEFSTSMLVPHGPWEISVTVLRPEGYDAHARFEIDTRSDLATPGSDKRTLDTFTLLFIIAAFGMLGLFAFFSRLTIFLR